MERNRHGVSCGSETIGHGDRPVSSGIPALRLAVGLGDPERERDLLPALVESGAMVVVQRCLSADQLMECVRRERVDAVLVAEGLHRLTVSVLVELSHARISLVLLTSVPDEPRWQASSARCIPLDADPRTVHQMLLATIRGEWPTPSSQTPAASAVKPTPPPLEAPAASLTVMAIASGPGSPGRTTVALNLAAGLGLVAPTVLVDADLSGPSVAAHIDADPTRNLYMLAHAAPESVDEWSDAIERESQPLGGQSVHGVALCGAPKLELRTGITPRFLERLIHELRRRFRYVILDIGAELLTREAAPHRAALQCADQVLLVAAADLVGLWHAGTGLGLMQGQLGIEQERLALVVNRHDRRMHHGSGEIEWAMGQTLAAVIPNDYVAAQRSLAVQRPLVLTGRGPAARSMLDLAERVHGGQIRLPATKARHGRLDLLRRALPNRLTRSPQLSELKTQGQFDHDHHTRDAARTVGGRPRSHRGESSARRRAGGSEPPAR